MTTTTPPTTIADAVAEVEARHERWARLNRDFLRDADRLDDDQRHAAHFDIVEAAKLTHAAGYATNMLVTFAEDQGQDVGDCRARLDVLGPWVIAEHFAYVAAPAGPSADGTPTPGHALVPYLIDWGEFWATDHAADDWLLEPLFARGRAHAVYAGAKSGKSYLILAAVASLATGKPFLAHPGGEPIHVLYLDYEMTEADLKDRLEEFGYGPDDDLTHLHYALLPSLPPLDTIQGGELLLQAARAVSAELVIVDTTGRAISGDENDAKVLQDYYRCTGLLLKQAGITAVRVDHAGKDVEKGQRGTSAKNDDVDVVWRLTPTDSGRTLTATHRRMSWVPEKVDITVAADDRGVMTFAGGQPSWPAGTKDLALALDEWGVPLDMGERSIRTTYRDQLEDAKALGLKVGPKVLRPAMKYRREQAGNLWISAVEGENARENAGSRGAENAVGERGHEVQQPQANARENAAIAGVSGERHALRVPKGHAGGCAPTNAAPDTDQADPEPDYL